jgi:hypothetical protein
MGRDLVSRLSDATQPRDTRNHARLGLVLSTSTNYGRWNFRDPAEPAEHFRSTRETAFVINQLLQALTNTNAYQRRCPRVAE